MSSDVPINQMYTHSFKINKDLFLLIGSRYNNQIQLHYDVVFLVIHSCIYIYCIINSMKSHSADRLYYACACPQMIFPNINILSQTLCDFNSRFLRTVQM